MTMRADSAMKENKSIKDVFQPNHPHWGDLHDIREMVRDVTIEALPQFEEQQ